MEKIQIKSLIILIVSFLFLFNCSTPIKTSKDKSTGVKKIDNIEKNNAQLSQITDIPMPEESIIDLEKTDFMIELFIKKLIKKSGKNTG